jgi:hypothetical protein
VQLISPASRTEWKSRYYSLAIQEMSSSQNAHPDVLGLYMTPVLKTEPSIKFRALEVVSKHPAKARNDIPIMFIMPARDASGIQSTY